MAIGEGFNALAADRRAIDAMTASNYFNSISATRANQAMAMDAAQRENELNLRYAAMDQAERERAQRDAFIQRQQDYSEARDARDFQENQRRYFDNVQDTKAARDYQKQINDRTFKFQDEEASYKRKQYEDNKEDRLAVFAQKAADVQAEFEQKQEKLADQARKAQENIEYFSKKARAGDEKAQMRVEQEQVKLKYLDPEVLKDSYLRKHPDLGYDDDGFFSRVVRAKQPNPNLEVDDMDIRDLADDAEAPKADYFPPANRVANPPLPPVIPAQENKTNETAVVDEPKAQDRFMPLPNRGYFDPPQRDEQAERLYLESRKRQQTQRNPRMESEELYVQSKRNQDENSGWATLRALPEVAPVNPLQRNNDPYFQSMTRQDKQAAMDFNKEQADEAKASETKPLPKPFSPYKSDTEVKNAVKTGSLTKAQAIEILKRQFGYN